MSDIFVGLILGHLFGDYLFQSKKMALQKSEKGWTGFWWCTIHSVLYTITVCLFLWNFHWQIFVLVFLSHWFIDRWSLASEWLKLIKGRNLIEAHNSKDIYREIDISFSCLVYTIVDNTMHFFLLWLMVKLLF